MKSTDCRRSDREAQMLIHAIITHSRVMRLSPGLRQPVKSESTVR
jgi:hypothetical protein